MEDDPWSATADPWGTSNVSASTLHVNPAISSSPDNHDRILATTLTIPRSNSLSESDPWASPDIAKVNLGAASIPISAIKNDAGETDAPTLSTAKWAVPSDADDSAWVKSLSVPAAADLPSATSGSVPSATFVAEQVPLPLDEEAFTTDTRPGPSTSTSSTEDVWGASQNLDDPPDIAMNIAMTAPAITETAFRKPVDDETHNPFEQEDQKTIAQAEETSAEVSLPAVGDDDGFGGFAAGGLKEASGGFSFANDDDAYGGWGNDDVVASFEDVQDAWESTSAGFEAEDRNQSSSANRDLEIDLPDNDDEGGFHSIPAKQKNTVTPEQLQEETWEQERRRIERQEARAPIELINELVDQWRDVLDQVFIASESQDTGKEVVDGLDHETIIRKDRLMHKLTELPDDLSIFVPPVRNTMTWARYQDYLSTIKLDPSASILAKASAESAYRAARRKSQEQHDAWQARSRLGEAGVPDQSHQSATAASQDTDTGRSRWSLWGRKPSAPVVPLTTSGGGLLDIKGMSPNHTGAQVKDKASGSGHSSSTSISTRNDVPPMRPPGTSTLAEMQTSDVDPAPSAVGRFFGRFRRTPNTVPSVDISNRDLELTQDDFSFLADVPSMAPKLDIGADLLSLDNDQRPSEQMTSLEAVLNSNAMPLPSKLAPPPRLSASRGHSSRQHGLTAFNSKASSVIDLFGDLDLTGSPTPDQSPLPAADVSSSSGFDVFATTFPPPATSPSLNIQQQSVPRLQVSSANSLAGNPGTIDNDGFDDFGIPIAAAQANSTSDFDDFGDFKQFSTQPMSDQQHAFRDPSGKPSVQTNKAHAHPTASRHASIMEQPRSSPLRLDHSSTARLVSNAAQSPSQWPVSKSPSIPSLPPPIPPPTVRQPAVMTNSASSSRAGTPLNFDFLASGPSMLAPSRVHAASPANPVLGGVNVASRPESTPPLSKGNGLSASDLSFFDGL